MKTLFAVKMLALLCLVCTFSSCSKSDYTSDPVNPNSSVVSGNWTITNFRQRTEDKTSQYAGYSFSFAANGVLTATKSGLTTNGTWSYSAASSSTYMGFFTISLGNDDPLKRLNESWLVDAGQTNANQLKLTHPEAAEDEHVTFSK